MESGSPGTIDKYQEQLLLMLILGSQDIIVQEIERQS